MVDHFPLPINSWARYRVFPVATTLRTADEEMCYTLDMVFAILPHTHYAKGRAPSRLRPPLPFANCYFWIQTRIFLRIPTELRPGYDLSRAMFLSTPQDAYIEQRFSNDFRRAVKLRNQR